MVGQGGELRTPRSEEVPSLSLPSTSPRCCSSSSIPLRYQVSAKLSSGPRGRVSSGACSGSRWFWTVDQPRAGPRLCPRSCRPYGRAVLYRSIGPKPTCVIVFKRASSVALRGYCRCVLGSVWRWSCVCGTREKRRLLRLMIVLSSMRSRACRASSSLCAVRG